MEQLRLEYLAREERFMLDGDRSELRDIKQELNELRYPVMYTNAIVARCPCSDELMLSNRAVIFLSCLFLSYL